MTFTLHFSRILCFINRPCQVCSPGWRSPTTWSLAAKDPFFVGLSCILLVEINVTYFNWRGSCKSNLSDFLGRFFFASKWAEFLHETLDLPGKHYPIFFFRCFVFCFREIMHAKLQVFLYQPWRQMYIALILLFGKIKALFGKDAARKKLRFCIRYLWKMKEKLESEQKRGPMLFYEVKGHVQKLSHLHKKNKYSLKGHSGW